MDGASVIVDQKVEAQGRLGFINSISGHRASCVLVQNTREGGDEGRYRAAQIGSLVKIRTERGSTVFGFVNGMSLHVQSADRVEGGFAVAEVEFFGEARIGEDGKGEFHRGVSVYPVLGAAVHSATHEDMAIVYAKPDSWHIEIGRLYQDEDQPAYLISQEFLCKHSAILGTTGSGKSCAVTLILRSLLAAHPNGHIVLLDPHGEYGPAFGGLAENIGLNDLQLPYWLLNFEEICQVVCSNDPINRAREAGILKEAIVAAKLDFTREMRNAPFITVDTPVPYRLSNMIQRLSDGMGKLERPDSALPYLRLIHTIEALQADRRYGFMFAGLSVRDNLSQIMSRLLRIPVAGKPVTILDISILPSEIVDVVVSLICRLVFDFAMWSDRDRSIPVLLVCDEAHRYVPADDSLGFAPTRRAMARIAKEGRKYGVSLCLVSQRPSELSENVLSQCSTVFAMRMASEKDCNFIRRTLPENASALLNTLPALRYQEAVVIGEGVTHPMHIRFLDLDPNFRPKSASANFPEAWENDYDMGDFTSHVIERWRRQERS